MSSPGLAWIDGAWHDLQSASVPVIDLGLLRGMALFETIRTRQHDDHCLPRPHTLRAHFQRLLDGLHHYRLVSPWKTLEELAEIIDHGIAQAAFTQPQHENRGARINIIATPGDLSTGMFGSDAPRGIVLFTPLTLPPDALLLDGIAVVTHPALRVDPSFKTTCYLMGRPALLAARAAGAAEALYVDDDGFISEGVTSNCGIVRDGVIVVPDAAALAGITLSEIAALAAERDIVLTKAPLRAEDFRAR